MEDLQPKPTLSVPSKRLVAGGLGLIFLWAIVNYVPSTVAPIASSEQGKIIIFWAQVALFLCACISLVVVCALLLPTRDFKISKFRIGSAEITFKKQEIDTDGKD